MANQNNK